MTDSDTAARIVVADGSRTVRRMIAKFLGELLPEAEVVGCAKGAEALAACADSDADLVSTALILEDMDGLELCRRIREESPSRYIPIIVVSGEADKRLVERAFGSDVTDYFDKRHGLAALGKFIEGYVRPRDQVSGRVLYVEDSRVVALATTRMLERSGLVVNHMPTAEEAIQFLRGSQEREEPPGADLILTDVFLKGGLDGKQLVQVLRGELQLDRRQLPCIVMTGDDNPKNQRALLEIGANDLVEKPVEERTLVNKLRFQLHLKQLSGA